MYNKDVRIRVSWAFLDGKDLNLGKIRSCLNFDSAALGVVKAEDRGKIEKPSFWVLWGKRGDRNK